MKKLIRRRVVSAGLAIAVTGGVAGAIAAHAGAAGPAGRSADHAPVVSRNTPTTMLPAAATRRSAPSSPTATPRIATATSATENVLAPISGQLGDLVNIVNGIAADPNAPLTDGQTHFIDDLNRRTAYWNNYVGDINTSNTMWDDASRSIEFQRDEQRQHDAMADTIDNINYEVRKINSYPDTWDHNLMLVAMPESASQPHTGVAGPAHAVSL